MKVSEIMSSPAVTVRKDTTLHDAIEVMLEERVGSAVVGEDTLAGILTRSDVLRAAYYVGDELEEIPVTEGMSSNVVTTTTTASTQAALETMETRNIKKLPVVDDFDLVGVVTMTDIAQHMPSRVREVQERLERKDEWTD